MPQLDWNDPATFAEAYDGPWRGINFGYRRHILRDMAARHAQGLRDTLSLTATDNIILVGSGYSWTVEWVHAVWPAANVVGLDTSTHVQATKATPETAELRQIITDAGLDPDAGLGAMILAEIDDGGNRAREPVIDEDLANNGSINAVKSALGIPNNQAIDWAISESVLETMGAAAAIETATRMSNAATNVAHLIICRPDTHAGLTLTQDDLADPFSSWSVTKPSGEVRVKYHTGFRWLTRVEWRALADANGFGSHTLIDLNGWAVF
jgi:hypothetical protein